VVKKADGTPTTAVVAQIMERAFSSCGLADDAKAVMEFSVVGEGARVRVAPVPGGRLGAGDARCLEARAQGLQIGSGWSGGRIRVALSRR
jgi:hypothetical protein